MSAAPFVKSYLENPPPKQAQVQTWTTMSMSTSSAKKPFQARSSTLSQSTVTTKTKGVTDLTDERVDIEAMKLRERATLPALRPLLESIQIKQRENKNKAYF
jgi:hypothetical protein